MEAVAAELIETGFVEGFEFCHFRAQRGMRVDGYWFNDEGALDLFVADFDCRNELATLTRTDVDAAFKRITSFFEAKPNEGTVERAGGYIAGIWPVPTNRRPKGQIRQLNLILVSERTISDLIENLPDSEILGVSRPAIISGIFPASSASAVRAATRKRSILISSACSGTAFRACLPI